MTEMTQTHRLQEVATLLLKIYQTLARMQYLDPSWITPGPHNLDHMLPLFHAKNLHPDLIHLYTILPYVNDHGVQGLDFFHGGEFVDFRSAQDFERSRDPFYMDVDLQPWITPLSLLGNHMSVLFYDSRRHRIAIEDQMGGTTDYYFRTKEGRIRVDVFEEEQGGEEEQGPKNEHGHGYDGFRWRDAGDVLRDINGWYEDLTETPGGGEQSGIEWRHEEVKPLYIKHGWPGEAFDGEAFLVDAARAMAASSAKRQAEEPLRKVQELESALKRDEQEVFGWRMEKAKTVEEEWEARWELFLGLRIQKQQEQELITAKEIAQIDCPGGVCQKPEELPLWELPILEGEVTSKRRGLGWTLEWIKKMDPAKKESLETQTRLRFKEKEVMIFQKALEACKADIERLCAGKQLPMTVREREREADKATWESPNECIKSVTQKNEGLQEDIEACRQWITTQLPEGIEGVGKTVEERIARNQEYIDSNLERKELALKELETGEKVMPRSPFWRIARRNGRLPVGTGGLFASAPPVQSVATDAVQGK